MERQTKADFAAAVNLARQHKMMDLEMTLGQLAGKVGGGWASDNVVAWDRYIYRTPRTADHSDVMLEKGALAGHEARQRAQADRAVVNLDLTVNELLQSVVDNEIDKVAGWIWDHDRMTIIVAHQPEMSRVNPAVNPVPAAAAQGHFAAGARKA